MKEITFINNKIIQIIQIMLIALVILGGFIYFKSNTFSNVNTYDTLKEDDLIICFGDSLTYGFGAATESSYPSVLSKLINIKIHNAGINGEMSSEGLKRLPKVLQMNPKLVILCYGGNDILRKSSMEDLKSNLSAMIALIKESGADVILVGVPDFNIFSMNTHEVYYEVSDEMRVLLEDKSIEYIQSQRNLKSDFVHPNAKGYELIANYLYELLKQKNILNNLR